MLISSMPVWFSKIKHSFASTSELIKLSLRFFDNFLLIFAYLTRNVITSDAAQIVCFIAIMGAAVAVVEPIARAREKKKAEQAKVEPKRDVFK